MAKVSINQLAHAIDVVARLCPGGLAAITGDADLPSHDDLVTAATWTPAADDPGPIGSGNGEHVTDKVARVLAITGPIDAVGWPRIIAAAQEVRELYPLPWQVYRLHVTHIAAGDQWRDGGGGVRRIAEKTGVSIATVSRWRHLVPRRIAKAALHSVLIMI